MFETLFGIVFVTLCFVVGVAALAMPAGAFIRCGRYALSVICFAVAVLFSIGLAVFGPLPPKADIDVTVIKLGVALIFGVGGYLLWPRRRSIKYGDQLLELGEDLSELQEYVPSLRYDLDTNYRDVRAGLQQAEVGRNSWGLLLGEAAAFAWALGYYIEFLGHRRHRLCRSILLHCAGFLRKSLGWRHRIIYGLRVGNWRLLWNLAHRI